MRILPVDERIVGERLGHAIYDGRGRVMLAAGVTLSHRYVQLLQKRGYRSVPVQDALAPDVALQDAVREEIRQAATLVVRETVAEAGRAGRLHAAAVRRVVDQILAEMRSNPGLAYSVTCLRGLEEGLFFHSVNVCIYALILAGGLALDPVDLRHLGVGALLHDIGKVYYLDLVQKIGPLTPEEFAAVKRHTTDGFELLRRQPGIHLLSAHVALQHHERQDGTGYPRGLRGAQIHPWARVAAIADVYDTVTADRTYGRGRPPHEAMAELVAMGEAGKLEAQLVRQFGQRVAVYPTGTLVLLASGELAVVVAQTPLGPSRPRVRVLTDRDLRLLAEPSERVADGSSEAHAVRDVLADYPRRVREQLRAAGAAGDAG